jgi:hypothetical protein
MTNKVDLSKKNHDYAIFTPALSGFYSSYVSKQQATGNHVEAERIPAKFENGIEGLNFLNPEAGYFTYNHVFYSAGRAERDRNKAPAKEGMIHGRDKNFTTLIGDSGGFQISKGVWQGNWLEPEGQCTETDKTRGKVLNWLENTADYSMVLDIPTNGLNFVDEATGKPRCGLNDYSEFRDATIANNNYFFKHRQGKTKFLNVCQGSTYTQADDWFDKVCLPVVGETHGWAFGGIQKTMVNHSLRRLLYLKELKILENSEWIHFLGTGRLDQGVMYTAMQRAIRKHINPTLTISMDCASPFIATANGQVYTHNTFDNKRIGYNMVKMVDEKDPHGKDTPWPWDDSPIGERLTWKDINWYDPSDLNKIGKEGKTSWDSFAYCLMMGHNIYKHIDSVQMANRLMARTAGINPWVPSQYIEFDQVCESLFEKDYGGSMAAIDAELLKHEKLIAKLSRTKSLKNSDTFDSLFSFGGNTPLNTDIDSTQEEDDER